MYYIDRKKGIFQYTELYKSPFICKLLSSLKNLGPLESKDV